VSFGNDRERAADLQWHDFVVRYKLWLESVMNRPKPRHTQAIGQQSIPVNDI